MGDRQLLNDYPEVHLSEVQSGVRAPVKPKAPATAGGDATTATTATTPPPPAASPLATTPAFRWDGAKMQTRYANAVQVTGTREEIALLLGTHQVWHQTGGEVKEVVVPLEERVLLGPLTAKRLHLQLTLVLAAFEARYGKLNLDGGG